MEKIRMTFTETAIEICMECTLRDEYRCCELSREECPLWILHDKVKRIEDDF